MAIELLTLWLFFTVLAVLSLAFDILVQALVIAWARKHLGERHGIAPSWLGLIFVLRVLRQCRSQAGTSPERRPAFKIGKNTEAPLRAYCG